MQLNQRPAETGRTVAHDRVYRAMRIRIMHGEIEPGQALTLRGLGKEFGVSMTPAREAIRRLVSEGALFMTASGRVSTPEPVPYTHLTLPTIHPVLFPVVSVS